MNTFNQQVFFVLHTIPYGKVTTYGTVAKLAGYPGYARHVGKLLSNLPKDTQLPWHRVINSQGKISLQGEDLERQKIKLLSEDITVNDEGKIRLKDYLWQPE
ncbi:MAG: MGMT family protein [Vibrio sp.]